MNPHTTTTETDSSRGRAMRAALWLPGLLVALGAAVATAHGLYEVALAAATPPLIAGLYPLITDGLALVAYAATARLDGGDRRYAWAVVVLAAGLSGLAQASYLAEGVHTAPTALRFGIGAWPAIAAAIVAHLLYLIGHAERTTTDTDTAPVTAPTATEPTASPSDEAERPTVQLPAVQPEPAEPFSVQPAPVQPAAVERPAVERPAAERPAVQPTRPASGVQPRPSNPVRPVAARQAEAPARERADTAAHRYATAHGALPTVTHLMELADVSRGTAGEALKTLRQHPTPLHLVTENHQQEATP